MVYLTWKLRVSTTRYWDLLGLFFMELAKSKFKCES